MRLFAFLVWIYNKKRLILVWIHYKVVRFLLWIYMSKQLKHLLCYLHIQVFSCFEQID